jgi:hypothetical protein
MEEVNGWVIKERIAKIMANTGNAATSLIFSNPANS